MKTKMKKGTKVRIVGNSSNHQIPIGTVVTLTTRQNGYGWRVAEFNQYVNDNDIKPAVQNKADINEDIDVAKKALATAKAKLAYMKAAKTELFDETEFKVYAALQALKTKKGDFAKAQAIAKLITGE